MTSFSQLVQELIGGAIRRHIFTPWELELLLDLDTCRIRKSARPEMLRRYLRTVLQGFTQGASTPLRLTSFVERETRKRAPSNGGARTGQTLAAGLSSS